MTGQISRRPADECAVLAIGCNLGTPGWGNVPLGADFATTQEWLIPTINNTIYSQIWSDAVIATACATRTTQFNGGVDGDFNADCRNSAANANFSGHYFSWCAVMRFADELCPAPWRVPTRQDFINLDLNLGGDGQNRDAGQSVNGFTIQQQIAWYGGTEAGPNGGIWGGARFTGHAGAVGLWSYYWSSTEDTGTRAFVLRFSDWGDVLPQSAPTKNAGLAVRCVRDTTLLILPNNCNQNAPGWGAGGLGTVTWGNPTNTNIDTTAGTGATTFVSRPGATTPVAGLTNAQIWSGAVFAQGCAKGNNNNNDAFNGGTAGNFNADCRQSLHSFNNRAAARGGDFFSWCAVVRFADVLCPDGWRVPTTEDFRNLHWILTGDTVATSSSFTTPIATSGLYAPNNAQQGNTLNLTNPASVGGTWGGARFTGHAGGLVTASSRYWSSSESFDILGRSLTFSANAVSPEGNSAKEDGLALRCVRDTVDLSLPMTGCNAATPLFGGAGTGVAAGQLGNVTWGNTANANIETGSTVVSRSGSVPPAVTTNPAAANNIQIWSGAVFAQGCAKGDATSNAATFNGGTTGNFNADCRQSLHTFTAGRANGITGDLFSWCAVMRFADQLCPAPWRVPTTDDFRVLHWILSGNTPSVPGASANINTDALRQMYMNPTTGTAASPTVGGSWGGARFTGWPGALSNATSAYWSSTETDATGARTLHFNAMNVWPETSTNKFNGFALRCVRDLECDWLVLATDISTANQTVGSGQTIAPITVNLVSGPSGTATAVNIRWTPSAPAGITFNAATRTISGSTTQLGNFTFEIFTTNHAASCPEAVFTGTLRVILPMTGCNLNTPGFGGVGTGVTAGQLGNVTWGNRTNSNPNSGTTTVGSGATAQTWSGAVFAQGCNKGNATNNNAFSGGNEGTLNADCRRSLHSFNNAANPAVHITGDLFSWCAVMRFADQLCPAPWRVPTADDFAQLFLNLTGSATPPAIGGGIVPVDPGLFIPTAGDVTNPQIGGVWGGVRFTGSSNGLTNTLSPFWSSTETGPNGAMGVHVHSAHVSWTSFAKTTNGNALRCVRDTVIPLPTTGCNNLTPGWGAGGLGTISWGGNTSIDALAITLPTRAGTAPSGRAGSNPQVWSRAVSASACDARTTQFNGGTTGNFAADCRNSVGNNNFDGHYFSWCAVMRFADVLCPAPWRVPSQEDFRDLHWFLTGQSSYGDSQHTMAAGTYMSSTTNTNLVSGGLWGGARFTGLVGALTLADSFYWSSTESSATGARHLNFNVLNVFPELEDTKGQGFAVRCVR